MRESNSTFELHNGAGDYPIQVPEDTELTFIITRAGGSARLSTRTRLDFKHLVTNPDTTVATINFRRYIGIHDIDIRAQESYLRIAIDVCPRKMSYDTDLFALRSDLETTFQGLTMDISGAGSLTGGWDASRTPHRHEWVSQLESEIDSLEIAFQAIAARPSQTIRRHYRFQRLSKVRPSQLDHHSRLRVGQRLQEPATTEIFYGSKSALDFRNPANLWLKWELSRVRSQLLDLLSSIGTKRQEEQFEFISVIESRMSRMLRSEFLADLPNRVPSAAIPINVRSKPGYSAIFATLDSLSKGFEVADGIARLGIGRLDDLYEAWCFIKVASLIQRLTNGTVDLSGLTAPEGASPDVRLTRGEFSVNIVSTTREEQISVAYNREYKGVTGSQRPDIVIKIQRNSLSPIVIILDAKYRIDTTERYLKSFKIAGPPIDAVNVLHRYRDAIVMKSDEHGPIRPVVQGVILFPPNTNADVDDWTTARLYRSIDEIGVGAIPLLPGQESVLKNWLAKLLSLDDLALAWPGPPFQPFDSLARRQLADIRGNERQ